MNISDLNRPAIPHGGRPTRRRLLGVAGAGLAAGLIGARGPGRAAAQEASPAAGAPGPDDVLGTVTPARAALVVERLPELAQDILDATGVPGMSVAVVYNDTVTYVGGFGVRELGAEAMVDGDTVFQLASVSKSVASTVVAAVVGDGAISWDTRMSEIDPGFALHDAWPTQEVTLADLFSHRSGLRDHAGDLLEDLGFGRDEIIHRLRFLEPAYSFRGGYAYTNFGLTAAAIAAARAAGSSWEDLSARRLYQPLGMRNTSSRFDEFMARSNRASPHVKDGGGWIVSPAQRAPDPQTPAGGVSSTAQDLARLMRLHLAQGVFDGNQLIPAAALAPTHVPQSVSIPVNDPATERVEFYGLGWNVAYDEFGAPSWGHSGAFALGAATAVYLLPASGFGVLALTNAYPVGAAEALCLSALDLAKRGELTRDWLTTLKPEFVKLATPLYGGGRDWDAAPAAASAALPDDAYIGTYHNDFYGNVEVAHVGGNLALLIGPEAREYPLTHFDRDTFSWQPPGENAPVRSGLVFSVNADGMADAFADDYFASGGPGVLSRLEAADG